LPAEDKTVLSDAAVVGQVFWTGAIAALDHGDRGAAEQRLANLARRDLVHPEPESMLAGEPQHAFHNALIREVAYEQLSRVERAAKHAAVARWIEATIATDEAAEIVAYHYVSALELAETVADRALQAELLGPTLQALELAGDHALPLDVTAAERHHHKAVELAGDGPRRPYALVSWAEALAQSGRLREAGDAFDNGIAGLRALGDERAASAASTQSWYVHWMLADGEMLLSSEVTELAETGEASSELIAVLESCGSRLSHAGRITFSMRLADRAVAICAQLGLPEPLRALDLRGCDRCILGDAGGLDDLRHAVDLTRQRQAGHLICTIATNLGEYLTLFEGPGSALRVHRETLETARQRGDGLAVCFCRSMLFVDQVWVGRWDAALAEVDELERLLEDRSELWDLQIVRATHAQLLAWRGDSAAAAEKAAWAEERSRETPMVDTRVTCLISSATAEAGLGNDEAALRFLEACTSLLNDAEGVDAGCARRLPGAIRLAIGLGRPDVAQRLAKGLPAARPFDAATQIALDALLLETRGDRAAAVPQFTAAADRWRDLGVPYEQAQAQLGQGRCLAAVGESAAARAALELARDGFAGLGAQPALREAETLLAALADGRIFRPPASAERGSGSARRRES
jgi:tetratricopeptide (TPR) repeat protein